MGFSAIPLYACVGKRETETALGIQYGLITYHNLLVELFNIVLLHIKM